MYRDYCKQPRREHVGKKQKNKLFGSRRFHQPESRLTTSHSQAPSARQLIESHSRMVFKTLSVSVSVSVSSSSSPPLSLSSPTEVKRGLTSIVILGSPTFHLWTWGVGAENGNTLPAPPVCQGRGGKGMLLYSFLARNQLYTLVSLAAYLPPPPAWAGRIVTQEYKRTYHLLRCCFRVDSEL